MVKLFYHSKLTILKFLYKYDEIEQLSKLMSDGEVQVYYRWNGTLQTSKEEARKIHVVLVAKTNTTL